MCTIIAHKNTLYCTVRTVPIIGIGYWNPRIVNSAKNCERSVINAKNESN